MFQSKSALQSAPQQRIWKLNHTAAMVTFELLCYHMNNIILHLTFYLRIAFLTYI
jgi:hypothetical protein